MEEKLMGNLGPLRPLVGTWEGVTGDDTAPSDDRGTEKNKYRERMVLEPVKPVDNHEQHLFGLRYHTQAFRIGESDPFHDEVGYWLWDPGAKRVMKCFSIPRGMAVVAGGKAASNAKKLKLSARLGSRTFGIASNPFLDREFQTIGFELEMAIGRDRFTYRQNTKIRIKGHKKIFAHRDENTLKRVK